MPKPRTDENRKDYLNRCMKSEEMQTKFPDEQQRYAVCVSYWEGKNMTGLTTHDTPFEYKFAADGHTFEGYGAIYDKEDQGNDIILKGAFDTAITDFKNGGRKPKMLWQHNPSVPIGTWKELASDSRGLYVKGKILPEIAKGAEVLVMMKEGVVDGLSIGYRSIDTEYKGENRLLKKLDLWEISVVTFPMHPDATVTAVKNIQSVRDIEHILRDAGVPNTFAKLVASHGYEEAKSRLQNAQRDAGEETEIKRQLAALLHDLKSLKETFNGN